MSHSTKDSSSNNELVENRPFSELKIGDSATVTRTVTLDDLRLFAAATGDANPAMIDPQFADSSIYREVVANGMWSGAMLVNLLGCQLPGLGTILVDQNLRFLRPIMVGDTATFKVTVERKYERTQHVLFDAEVILESGLRAITGTLEVLAPTEKIIRPRISVPEVILSNRDERLQAFLNQAKGLDPVVTAIAHPCDRESLRGAILAAEYGLIEPILVAPAARLEKIADEAGLNISRYRIIDTAYSQESARVAVELVRNGEAEALMKGSLHTDELMSAVVNRETGLRTARRLSHVFRMEVETYAKPILITDAAINIHPDLDAKVDIIQNAIDLAHVLGIAEPRVAILSAVETVNPKIQSTLDAAALCKMADRRQITGGVLDGPLAFDNAISADAARSKGIKSPVSGLADILVVPDLESGNMLAKQLEYLASAVPAGIVLGAKAPIVLTSRADNAETRMASCVIAVLMANANRQKQKPA
ncbi:MAG: bifunctional enoyl-CoA hydratase/phosphate acetyltransferase [Rhodocyclaceae bacterium]|nr:bifunctional enoyl-CoA hydratase/phosphate acetyltransferase [Rhodocyclaceae bacterium]